LGIERETGCSVSVGDGGKVILSAPDESSLGKAELMIQHIVDGRQFIERTIKVHEHNVGLVIGPGFSNLKMIQEKTGCLIQHGNGGDFFVRARSEEALKRAEEMIKESASSARTYSMTILIPIEKKKILCGPHYKQILRIKKESGTQIDVEDDGKILISSKIQKNLDVAFQLIKNIVTEARMEDITQRRG
jgi:polyribonucleotide nucleotidyltransferase